MNYEQIRYFFSKVSEPNQKLVHIAPISYEHSWPKAEQFPEFPQEPDFKDKEGIMKELAEWYKKHLPSFGLGGSQAIAQTKVDEGAKKEEKKEEKKEVTFTLN
jgi:hypothetical protein